MSGPRGHVQRCLEAALAVSGKATVTDTRDALLRGIPEERKAEMMVLMLNSSLLDEANKNMLLRQALDFVATHRIDRGSHPATTVQRRPTTAYWAGASAGPPPKHSHPDDRDDDPRKRQRQARDCDASKSTAAPDGGDNMAFRRRNRDARLRSPDDTVSHATATIFRVKSGSSPNSILEDLDPNTAIPQLHTSVYVPGDITEDNPKDHPLMPLPICPHLRKMSSRPASAKTSSAGVGRRPILGTGE